MKAFTHYPKLLLGILLASTTGMSQTRPSADTLPHWPAVKWESLQGIYGAMNEDGKQIYIPLAAELSEKTWQKVHAYKKVDAQLQDIKGELRTRIFGELKLSENDKITWFRFNMPIHQMALKDARLYFSKDVMGEYKNVRLHLGDETLTEGGLVGLAVIGNAYNLTSSAFTPVEWKKTSFPVSIPAIEKFAQIRTGSKSPQKWLKPVESFGVKIGEAELVKVYGQITDAYDTFFGYFFRWNTKVQTLVDFAITGAYLSMPEKFQIGNAFGSFDAVIVMDPYATDDCGALILVKGSTVKMMSLPCDWELA